MTSPDASAVVALPTNMLEYATAHGEQAIPLTPEYVHLLNQAGEYRSGSRLLRTSGMWDLVWGVPLTFIGMLVMFSMRRVGGGTFLYLPYMLLGLGVLMVAVGVWLIAAPSPLGMLLDGTTLILLSAINLWWFVRDMNRGDEPRAYWIIIFIVTFLSGIGRFRRYKRFANASRTPPPRATLDWLGEMLKSLKRTRIENDPTGFKFESMSSWPPFACRGRLTPDMAFCSINNEKISFYTREDLKIDSPIDLETLAATPPRKKIKVKIKLAERTVNATIEPQSLRRLHEWAEPPLMLDEAEDEP